MRKPSEFDKHPMAFETRWLRAVCKYVVDGDTIDVFVDEGLYDYAYITIRLNEFDAPEKDGATQAERTHALLARDYLEMLILDKPVKILTYKDHQSFGRFIAKVMFWDSLGIERDVVALMIAADMSKRLSYSASKRLKLHPLPEGTRLAVYPIQEGTKMAKKSSKSGGKVEKVMREYKHGELHSGSKHGPKVTSRKQAVAIAMSESGKSRGRKGK